MQIGDNPDPQVPAPQQHEHGRTFGHWAAASSPSSLELWRWQVLHPQPCWDLSGWLAGAGLSQSPNPGRDAATRTHGSFHNLPSYHWSCGNATAPPQVGTEGRTGTQLPPKDSPASPAAVALGKVLPNHSLWNGQPRTPDARGGSAPVRLWLHQFQRFQGFQFHRRGPTPWAPDQCLRRRKGETSTEDPGEKWSRTRSK